MSNIEEELDLLVEAIDPMEDIEKAIKERRAQIRYGILVCDYINEKGDEIIYTQPSKNMSFADANWLLDIAKDYVLHGDEDDSQ